MVSVNQSFYLIKFQKRMRTGKESGIGDHILQVENGTKDVCACPKSARECMSINLTG